MRSMTSRFMILLLCFVLISSALGCGATTGNPVRQPGETPHGEATPAPSAAAEPRNTDSGNLSLASSVTVIDQAGREVVIGGSVERIVSGYYISSSACIALGLTDKLVGIEAKADSRPIYAMTAPDLLTLPNVGTAKEFHMEACIALDPDLVILPKQLRDNAEIMAELGIPVMLVSPESHQALVDMIALIGEASGAQANASKLISYYNDELAEISLLTKNIDKRPTVYMGGNSAYLTAAPKDMYQATLIDAAGGINAAAEIDGDKWTDVSYEQIVAMNPDVIVIPPEAGYFKEDILGDPQLAGVTAIMKVKVYQMPRGFEAWDSPVPSCVLGIRWLLSVLHEEIYPMERFQTDAKSFYKEFYGTEIDVSLIGK